jgi:hypothetical protein
MTRPLYSRILSLALSLWLALFLGGSEWIVRCPTHGGGPHMAATAAHVAVTDGMSGVGHDHGEQPSAPADHTAGHNCSCPGPGCCPPAVAVVPGAAVPMAHTVAVHQARAVSTLDRLESEADYLQPFATPPPTVALASAA